VGISITDEGRPVSGRGSAFRSGTGAPFKRAREPAQVVLDLAAAVSFDAAR
jgi:hypothetical protein